MASPLTCYCTGKTNGDVNWNAGQLAFATAQRQTTGLYGAANPSTATAGAGIYQYTIAGDVSNIIRSAYVFDTSGIPAGATITSATVSFYVTAKTKGSALTSANAGLTLVNAEVASPTGLQPVDYNHIGVNTTHTTSSLYGTASGVNYLEYNNVTTSAYNTFDLNATGIAAINAAWCSGLFHCGLMYYCDYANSTPNWNYNTSSNYTMYYDAKDPSGGTYCPKLVVTYTTPSVITAIGATTGTTTVGSTLTVGGLTPGAATATYQWQRCTTSGGAYAAIGGATATTYTPVSGDEAYYIEVVATGSGSYSGTVTSSPVGPVYTVFSDTLTVNDKVAISTADIATRNPATTVGDKVAIGTAEVSTDNSTVTVFDRVAITEAPAEAEAVTLTDSDRVAISAGEKATSKPAVTVNDRVGIAAAGKTPLRGILVPSGRQAVGSVLTIEALDPPDATVTYQWWHYPPYEAISGATSATYTPVSGDEGCYLQVAATGTGSFTRTMFSPIDMTGPVYTVFTDTLTDSDRVAISTSEALSSPVMVYDKVATSTTEGNTSNPVVTDSDRVLITTEAPEAEVVTLTDSDRVQSSCGDAVTATVEEDVPDRANGMVIVAQVNAPESYVDDRVQVVLTESSGIALIVTVSDAVQVVLTDVYHGTVIAEVEDRVAVALAEVLTNVVATRVLDRVDISALSEVSLRVEVDDRVEIVLTGPVIDNVTSTVDDRVAVTTSDLYHPWPTTIVVFDRVSIALHASAYKRPVIEIFGQVISNVSIAGEVTEDKDIAGTIRESIDIEGKL